MLQRRLNLGILAHVDAGKTTLTERLLYAAGVIGELGSVDDGTAQTDSLALERRRGITIKSAVVSFALGDTIVNLVDTPGHPDFIAEVERVLSVLDGAVMVISAVEGVQPQTRILMRALQRLRIPVLVFVNKIDRTGADEKRVLHAISQRLALTVLPLGTTRALGTRGADFLPWDPDDPAARARLAEVLAERDDGILAAYIEDEAGIPYPRLREALVAQARRALVYPVFFGSAATGAGVEPLMAGIAELLPAAAGDAQGPVSAHVFKIDRGPSGDKVAYVRMFSGTVRTRDRLRFGRAMEDKVTAIDVFEPGSAAQQASVSAGQIAKFHGLARIQIGDRIGAGSDRAQHQFAPPTLESVIVADNPGDRARLRAALAQFAEQDPLINVHHDDRLGETSVSLYGELQKEIIQATLASEFGIDTTFREPTTICIERLITSGEAMEVLHARTPTNVTGRSSPHSSNPFLATIGLRIDPAPLNTGIEFRLDSDIHLVPMYIYKTADNFIEMMGQYIRHALAEGLFGWPVTDCVVTMNECGYQAPASMAADFRRLTPLVLMRALKQAGTMVYEPMTRAGIEFPTDTVGAVLATVARLGGAVETSSLRGELAMIEAVLPTARMQDLHRQLPAPTQGEGTVEASSGGYQPVNGPPPIRHRRMPNPLNRAEYLMHVTARAAKH